MEKKRTPLTLYASGLFINKIAGLLKVSPPAVLRLIRKLVSFLCPEPQPSKGQVLAMQDEFRFGGSLSHTLRYMA